MKKYNHHTNKELAKVLSMYLLGKPYEEMEKESGMTMAIISAYRRKAGIPKRPRTRRSKRDYDAIREEAMAIAAREVLTKGD